MDDQEVMPPTECLKTGLDVVEEVDNSIIRNVVKFEGLRKLQSNPAVLDVFHHVYLH